MVLAFRAKPQQQWLQTARLEKLKEKVGKQSAMKFLQTVSSCRLLKTGALAFSIELSNVVSKIKAEIKETVLLPSGSKVASSGSLCRTSLLQLHSPCRKGCEQASSQLASDCL